MWPNLGMTESFPERSQSEGPVDQGAVHSLTSTEESMVGKGKHLREEGGLKTGPWVLETAEAQKVPLGEQQELRSRSYSKIIEVMQGLLSHVEFGLHSLSKGEPLKASLKLQPPACPSWTAPQMTLFSHTHSLLSTPSCFLTLSAANIWQNLVSKLRLCPAIPF